MSQPSVAHSISVEPLVMPEELGADGHLSRDGRQRHSEKEMPEISPGSGRATRNQMRACVLSWCVPGNCRQVSVEAQSLQGLSEDQKLGLPSPWSSTKPILDNCPRAPMGLCFLARGAYFQAFSARLWAARRSRREAQSENLRPCKIRDGEYK